MNDVQLPSGIIFDDNKMSFSGIVSHNDSAFVGMCLIDNGSNVVKTRFQNKYGNDLYLAPRYHFVLIDFS